MSDPNGPSPEFDSLAPSISFTRRSFIVSALGAGFALSVQPIMAQTLITTDTDGLTCSEIKIPVADGALPAYFARPNAGKKFPTILVIQEIFGVHEHIKDVCRRLAKQGYLAIAPELYARQGDPRQYTNIQELMNQVVSKIPDAQVMSDLDACTAWAKGNGGDETRLGITGFCWGGRITWLYSAHNPQVRAGVAWYGRIVGDKNALTPRHPIDVGAALHGPVLGLYGGQDQGIPLDTVAAMRGVLASGTTASKESAIVIYDDAPHAFHADYRPSYRKEAAEDGWKRLLAWFKANGI
ncbi:dienelactone hydrolase family protein [Propionivibrio dicarboxylicus]|uniref:Carboxymethylenebutenolidase n=1 Tax=Propionivibrio dicarboxylicus TaxID=83767 RepID=A0A1G7VLY0_9RHOO|nr:dienelactone hydrolase family protein [Propionivibrio dicarboxylicus]SDG60826.1 carboxymethylenebutenolidase [Propionivibrio dicarboxylicus]